MAPIEPGYDGPTTIFDFLMAQRKQGHPSCEQPSPNRKISRANDGNQRLTGAATEEEG
jgi:hypothetical protein